MLLILMSLILVFRKDFKGVAVLLAVMFFLNLLFSSYFLVKTNNFNYFKDIQIKARYNKYFDEYKDLDKQPFVGGKINYVTPKHYDYFFHLKNIFSRQGFKFGEWGYPYGILFILFVIFSPFALWSSSKQRFLVFTTVVYILFMEFGFVFYKLVDGHLDFYAVMKEIPDGVRYLSFLCGIAAASTAIGFSKIKFPHPFWRYLLLAAAILPFVFTSLVATHYITAGLTEPHNDLTEMANFLTSYINNNLK